MTRQLQVRFHNIHVKGAVEDEIRARMHWLETFHPNLIGGKVVIDVPHKHRRRGRPLRVNIELAVPGGEVVVNHETTADTAGVQHDVVLAVHEAFDAARRQLEDVARRQRGD